MTTADIASGLRALAGSCRETADIFGHLLGPESLHRLQHLEWGRVADAAATFLENQPHRPTEAEWMDLGRPPDPVDEGVSST